MLNPNVIKTGTLLASDLNRMSRPGFQFDGEIERARQSNPILVTHHRDFKVQSELLRPLSADGVMCAVIHPQQTEFGSLFVDMSYHWQRVAVFNIDVDQMRSLHKAVVEVMASDRSHPKDVHSIVEKLRDCAQAGGLEARTFDSLFQWEVFAQKYNH